MAFAAGTVAFVGVLARRLYGPGLALAAAAFIAVDVVHVRQASLASVDASLACWCVAVVWAAVRLLQNEAVCDYGLAGFLVGLAGGTKYPGAIIGGTVLVAHLLAGRGIGDRRLWFAGCVAVLTFAATSPYIFLDYEGFLGNFLFQVAHVGEGRGAGGSAWYQVFWGLRHSLGLLGVLSLLFGFARVAHRREPGLTVVAAAFFFVYVSIAWGQLSFARYALPLLPLMAVLVAGGLGFVRHRGGQVVLAMVLAVGPLYGAVRVAQLMGREDVRLEARRWIEERVPAGTTCCNFAGWAGDVPLRTGGDHWWRLLQFEGSFGAAAVGETMDFLAGVGPNRPFYSYAVQTGNRALESGSWALADDWRCAYVLLHRHPLSYSRLDTAFAATLAERGRRVAVWRPEGLADAESVYDADDAYYLPLADFGPLRQPGPEVEVWRVDEYAEGGVGVQGAREIFAKAYAVWAAVKQHNEERSDSVGRLLQKALAMRAADPSIYNDIGIEYRKLRDYQAALAAWGKALELDPGYGKALYNLALVHQVELRDPQAAIPLWHRAIAAGEDSAETYSHLANAYNLSKNPSEGLRWLRRVLERYPDSSQARQVREMMRTQEERL
ncbi:MAG: tetratricopeptide repeat protein [Candidatus Latescibacteria bacterium]|nr:tetratricopeptide repeat protein [Candidatus Latescibacterota bacterium]